MGDSYGSGQGNPDIPGVAKTDTVRVLKAFFVAYVLGPNAIDVVKEAAKAVTVEREPSWQFRQCNRSRASHQAQAALMLEKADRRTSVTFIHTACSGARLPHLLADAGYAEDYEGQEPLIAGRRQPWLPSQIDQVASRRIGKGGREVDALLVSIGGNDVYFGSIVALCALPPELEYDQDPCQDMPVVPVVTSKDSESALVPARVRPQVQDRPLSAWVAGEVARLGNMYGDLHRELSSRFRVANRRVYLVPYPDPTTDSLGRTCASRFPFGWLPSGFITAVEANWVRKNVVEKLWTVQSRTPWTYIGSAETLFDGHGWCEEPGRRWMRLVDESVKQQGLPFGGMHPTTPGLTAIAKDVLGHMCLEMYGTAKCKGAPPRKPRQ
jgi:hypothetical protein